MFFVVLGSIGKDSTKAISTSKIKNSTATKKNWKEKGRWEGFILLNPHSTWDHFSFSAVIFFCTKSTPINSNKTRSKDVNQTAVTFKFLLSFLLEIRCTIYYKN